MRLTIFATNGACRLVRSSAAMPAHGFLGGDDSWRCRLSDRHPGGVPTLFSAGRFFIQLAARCAASACQHARAGSALRHAGIAPRCVAPRLRAHARTHAQERPTTTNDATCGPPAWLTGSLHDGGLRSVRSPPRRAPLLAPPIATLLQGGRPERPGPFCFLNYLFRLISS